MTSISGAVPRHGVDVVPYGSIPVKTGCGGLDSVEEGSETHDCDVCQSGHMGNVAWTSVSMSSSVREIVLSLASARL